MVNDIHYASELVLGTDWYAHRMSLSSKFVSEVTDCFVKVSTCSIHLIDERYARHVVLSGLPPNGLRLGLHTCHTTENGHSPVEHTHGSLHLCSEVHVTWGVDDVDAIVDLRE